MKNKVFSLILVLIMCFAFGTNVPVFAQNNESIEGVKEATAKKTAIKSSSSSEPNVAMDMSALDTVCPNEPLECLSFAPCAMVPVCPVFDIHANVGLIAIFIQEKLGYVASMYHKSLKDVKVNKFSSLGRTKISRKLSKYTVPNIKDYENGTESAVDAYKGRMQGLETRVVDFKDDKQTADVLKEAIVVSKAVTHGEQVAERERKEAFVQQSILDLLARVLYYKTELNKLRDMDAEMEASLGMNDTIGNLDISERMKDANERIQALQEKILAMRLEVQSIKNFKASKYISHDISIQ